MQKKFHFFKQCKLYYVIIVGGSKQQHMSSAVDLRYVLEELWHGSTELLELGEKHAHKIPHSESRAFEI